MSQSDYDYAMTLATEDDNAESSLSSSFSVATPSNAFDSFSSRFNDIPEDVEKIKLLGRTFVLESSLAKRGRRSGWFWKHGRAIIECSSKTAYFQCLECKKTWLLKTNSTDHIHKHLRKDHNLGPQGKLSRKGPIDHSLASAFASPSSSSVDSASALLTTLQLDTFKKLIMRWIVCKRITFTQVESDEFRDLVVYLHHGLGEWLPRSGKCDPFSSLFIYLTSLIGKTIQSWIIKEFELRKKQFQDLLLAVRGLIHISFDLWTSGNALALLGMVFHYYDGITGVKTVTAALPRIYGKHSGENIAASACEVIGIYQIIPKLGFFTLDNASTNDTAVEAIITKIRPDLTSVSRRLRCFGHVMNIVAKVLLYGKISDSEKDEAEDFASQVLNVDTRTLDNGEPRDLLGSSTSSWIISERLPKGESSLRLSTSKRLAMKPSPWWFRITPPAGTRCIGQSNLH